LASDRTRRLVASAYLGADEANRAVADGRWDFGELTLRLGRLLSAIEGARKALRAELERIEN
jgi:hypothetical protein